MLFILTIFLFSAFPFSLRRLFRYAAKHSQGTDECLRFAWEKYFVFREGEKKRDLLTMELFIFLGGKAMNWSAFVNVSFSE